MISDPNEGWCDFKVGDFVGHPSYLTGVPIDLLDCFFEYFWRGSSSAYFDEEGIEFTFVLSNYDVYIIKSGEQPTLYQIDAIPEELALDLLGDLEGNEQKWMDDFFMEPDASERSRLYNELINKVAILRNKLYKRDLVEETSDMKIDYKYVTRKNVDADLEEDNED